MSNDVVVATDEADAAAVTAVTQHHAQLAGGLSARVETLVAAAARSTVGAAREAQHELVRWCHVELAPHAHAEEQVLYPAAHGREAARLLIEGMTAEHGVITGLVDEIAGTDDAVLAAAAARALQAVFDSHLGKENELMLPLLAAACRSATCSPGCTS